MYMHAKTTHTHVKDPLKNELFVFHSQVRRFWKQVSYWFLTPSQRYWSYLGEFWKEKQRE